MPAGPAHTAVFILEPSADDEKRRTLYVKAVIEGNDKIKPSLVLIFSDPLGQLCGVARGSIHERQGTGYAYLATLALASALPRSTGTTIHETTHAVSAEPERGSASLRNPDRREVLRKMGPKVNHRPINKLSVRHEEGQEVTGNLVMLSMTLSCQSNLIAACAGLTGATACFNVKNPEDTGDER